MATIHFEPPLVPKNHRVLMILVPVRVSDPTKQDERSLDDQRRLIDQYLRDRTDYPFELTVFEGRESGELTEREEHFALVRAVGTGKYDAVIAEDVGRILRRIHAHLFCEHCVDFDTRLIALNDNVDTARPGWQDASIFSAWHHERSNRDTSDRIKRTHRSRFSQGGCLGSEIYGYLKLPGARAEAEMQKEPSAEPIYQRWFEMLDSGLPFAAVADWLNLTWVPVPPHARNARWDGKMVARHTFNPILKGLRERNRKKSKRFSNGKYKSVLAEPHELLTRNVPHLAFFPEGYYDRITAKVKERNAIYRRGKNGDDPRRNRPRKRTKFPGQIAFCGICGRRFVFGGHGQTTHLMCGGARERCCWNGVTFDGPLACRNIVKKILAEVEQLPNFDGHFLQLVQEESRAIEGNRDVEMIELQNRLDSLAKQIARLMRFIRDEDEEKVEHSPNVAKELRALESEQKQTRFKLEELKKRPSESIAIPSIEEIKTLIRKGIDGIDVDGQEFAMKMRLLIPRLVIFPYRLCDNGKLVCRAKFKVDFSALLPQHEARELLKNPLRRVLTVDLFEPPQREAFRKQIVSGRAAGESEKKIAASLGLTITATQRAAALQRTMDALKIEDAFIPLTEPPTDCPRLCRHKHPAYQFKPLPGAGDL